MKLDSFTKRTIKHNINKVSRQMDKQAIQNLCESYPLKRHSPQFKIN